MSEEQPTLDKSWYEDVSEAENEADHAVDQYELTGLLPENSAKLR